MKREGKQVKWVEQEQKEYQRNCLKMFSQQTRRDKSSVEISKADKLKLVCDIYVDMYIYIHLSICVRCGIDINVP